MRSPLSMLLLGTILGTACVATQFPHNCAAPCGEGKGCDPTVGLCKDDPCEGRCTPGQRCKAGPPPRCQDLNVGEVKRTGPREVSAPAEPTTVPPPVSH